MKILVSAYACEPNKGSEPEVGWQWVHQIARFHEVWVITRENNKTAIENTVPRTSSRNIHFVYYDLPKWTMFWKVAHRGVHIYHNLWQLKILSIARELHRKNTFDLCHHITFGVVWHPSLLCRLSIKYVWGPFGGGEKAYNGCLEGLGLRGKLIEFLKNSMGSYFFKLDPVVRLNFERASRLLTRTDATLESIPTRYTLKTKVFLETGFEALPAIHFERPPHDEINIFTMCRLIPYKNVGVIIEAMKMIIEKTPHVKLNIFGNGNLEQDLKYQADRLRIGDRVVFHGKIEHSKLLQIIGSLDILVHPAVRDGGTHAIMEAMAYGIPVICLDNAGPGYMVDETSGIKITGSNRKEIVEKFAEAVVELSTNTEKRMYLSKGAMQRVRDHFLWDNMGDRLNKIYEEVMSEK